jgi:O-antigen ligase
MRIPTWPELRRLGPFAGILAIAALLPFERIGAVDLGGTTIRPSQFALVLLLLPLARMAFFSPERLALRRPPHLWLAVFFAAAALSLVNAENFRRSLIVLAFTAFTALLAVALPALVDDAEKARRVRNAVLLSAAVVGLYGIWQFVGDMAGAPRWLTGLRPQYTKAILGFTRIQSTALEPLYFADYLLLPIGLAAAWLMSGAGKTSRKLYALLAVLLLNLILTASRGGYLGLIATFAVLVLSYRKRLPALRRLFGIGLVGLAVAATGLFALSRYAVTTPGSLADRFLGHVTTITDGAAFEERIETFSGAIAAHMRHPWIGVGIGGYGPFMARYAGQEPEIGWAIVNNETLELLAEVGIVGLVAFVIFLVLVFREGSRPVEDDLDPIRIGAAAALAGMIVQYQTFSTLYIMHLWFTIGLLLAISRFSRRP